MKSAKTKNLIITLFIVIMLAYSVVMWIMSPEYNFLFILTYIFTLLATASLAYCVSFLKDKLKKITQNYSLIAIGWVNFVLQIVISALVLVLSTSNVSVYWVTILIIVLQIAFFAIFVLRLILLILGKRYIENVGAKDEADVNDIRLMLIDIDSLIERTNDFGENSMEAKEIITEVYNAIKYSDPISKNVENEEGLIKENIQILKKAVNENDIFKVNESSTELLRQIKDRNTKIRLLKE